MAIEIYNKRFKVIEIIKPAEASNCVYQTRLANKSDKITIDYKSDLFEINIDNTVDLIIYNGIVTNEEVSYDYEYIMCGKMYKSIPGEISRYLGSFGGLRFEFDTRDSKINLDDRCEISIALKRL